ncbi:hypothetical protein G6F70_003920 [Rhizopus microsporus]|nr:hypothetical protein G6F71_002494 [Rhizopus microsporus]KAG1200595.1 hypothetical protein G6F70_003920 [Rhizopus microsporus]KAG1214101.1 hypothetical protein G6F69_002237 [Rhizopus microsporus]KAG1234928.1 hypothetical protein G6F67_003159 [Rhizopus microsporus]KAG1266586.1 hypothetical protein G6F68_002630 [Rhizopus microsporus]
MEQTPTSQLKNKLRQYARNTIKDKTVAQWNTNSLTAVGIDPDKFTAHSIRAATSTYAVQQGASIQEVKIHANWSLNAETFEKY